MRRFFLAAVALVGLAGTADAGPIARLLGRGGCGGGCAVAYQPAPQYAPPPTYLQAAYQPVLAAQVSYPAPGPVIGQFVTPVGGGPVHAPRPACGPAGCGANIFRPAFGGCTGGVCR